MKVFLVALIIGIGGAYYVNKFDSNLIASALSPSITYFSVGTYNNLELAKEKSTSYKTAVIYESKGLYKVIIGVYSDKDTVELMRSYFKDLGYNFSENKMRISGEVRESAKNYELLIKSSDKTYYESLNNSLLELFRSITKV